MNKTVTVTSIQKYQNIVNYGEGQSFYIDEPENVGGSGTGPDPYTLLLSSIGGCTSMTVSMYAERKGWQLERVTVELSHERIHAKDCEECANNGEAFIHQINIALKIEGNLTEEQLTRLREIADKCPVKKTLSSGIRFVSV
jgi:uncharacterized OsmC-like protein